MLWDKHYFIHVKSFQCSISLYYLIQNALRTNIIWMETYTLFKKTKRQRKTFGGSREGDANLFFLVSSNRMHGNSSNLHQRRFRLDIIKNFFTKGVVRHWNRFPIEVVDALCLSVFKSIIQMPLNDILWISPKKVWQLDYLCRSLPSETIL